MKTSYTINVSTLVQFKVKFVSLETIGKRSFTVIGPEDLIIYYPLASEDNEPLLSNSGAYIVIR